MCNDTEAASGGPVSKKSAWETSLSEDGTATVVATANTTAGVNERFNALTPLAVTAGSASMIQHSLGAAGCWSSCVHGGSACIDP